MRTIIENTVSVVFMTPFWMALFEEVSDGEYRVAKQNLGTSEPTGGELLAYFKDLDWNTLQYTLPEGDECACTKKINFKRMQRQIKKATVPSSGKYTYTKAHEALKKQHEELKKSRKSLTRKKKEMDKQRQFELKQQKKKLKIRGK